MTPLTARWPSRVIVLSMLFAATCTPKGALAQVLYPRPGISHLDAPRRPVFRHRLFYLVRPILPIFTVPPVRFWGAPLYGFGLGLGFSPLWWRTCGIFWSWTWGYNCYAQPVYVVGTEVREFPQLYLKDGTVYNVTDYWLVDNQLHFTMLDETSVTSAEHTIDFSRLDLQKTTDVARQRGFQFVLRNEPIQKYLEDHPELHAIPHSIEPPER
jgi:hypothetical protein